MKCINCMLPCRMLYIDRNGVSVTKYTLKVRRHAYPLKDITKQKLSVINPTRIPGFLLLVMGAGLIMCSAISPIATMPAIQMAGKYVTLNGMSLYFGVIFMVVGIFKIVFVRRKFALRIATAKGEKNAIVSTNRAYIIKIMNTLKTTFETRSYIHY